jgi:cytochrome o ubiquinol oxidase operon protein cyoD
MGPSPEDTDRGPRSQLSDIGRSLRSHLTDIGRSLGSHLGRIGRSLASHLERIGRELPGQLERIGRGLLAFLTHIGRGLRSAGVGAHRSVRSYLAGIDRDLRPYLIGFALALILTAIPFALVATNPLPKLTTLIIIGVAAAIQVLVHLRYFLHLDLTSTPRENLVAIVFTAMISSEHRTLHKSSARMRGLPMPARCRRQGYVEHAAQASAARHPCNARAARALSGIDAKAVRAANSTRARNRSQRMADQGTTGPAARPMVARA